MRMAKTLTAVALGIGAATVSWACLGGQDPTLEPRGKPGVGEQIGAAIDRAARVASRRARKVGADVEAAYQRAQDQIRNFGVEARITGRLVWDKALQDAAIELEVDDAGDATLHGTVPTEAARDRAGELTRVTIGVRKVVDALKVVPPRGELEPPAPRRPDG
jgi:hypothetical protein